MFPRFAGPETAAKKVKLNHTGFAIDSGGMGTYPEKAGISLVQDF